MNLIGSVRKNSLVIILFFAIAFAIFTFSFREGLDCKKKDRS